MLEVSAQERPSGPAGAGVGGGEQQSTRHGEGTFDGAGGARLYYQWWYPEPGAPRAVDELVGDALKRRDDGDDRLPLPRLEQNPADAAYGRGRGQRRAAELEDSHEYDR